MKRDKKIYSAYKINNNNDNKKRWSYLQNLASVRVAVDVLTGMKHAQGHTVQQDHQHGRSLEPCTGSS